VSDTQNPVYTDNDTILGDGTVENPLTASGGAISGQLPQSSQFNGDSPIAVPGDGSTVLVFDETITVPSFLDGNSNTNMLCSFEFDAGAAAGVLVVSIGILGDLITYTKTLVSGEKAIICVTKNFSGMGTGPFEFQVAVAYTSADAGSIPAEQNLQVLFVQS